MGVISLTTEVTQVFTDVLCTYIISICCLELPTLLRVNGRYPYRFLVPCHLDSSLRAPICELVSILKHVLEIPKAQSKVVYNPQRQPESVQNLKLPLCAWTNCWNFVLIVLANCFAAVVILEKAAFTLSTA